MTETRRPSMLPKLTAEALGTYILVFAGCGSVVADVHFAAGLGTLGIALVFGFVVMVMIYALGHISGAHLNPAVTLAFAGMGRFPKGQIAPYIIAQLIGATLAAGTLRWLLAPDGSLGETIPKGEVTGAQAAVMEGILSFVLMFVITAVATDSRAVGHMAGWAIGATVAICAAIGGPVAGASMNPARTFGPAVFTDTLGHMWIYLAGPILGAMLGAATYQFIRCDPGADPGGDASGCC